MTEIPVAHVGGVPIEETLGPLGPAFLVVLGMVWAQLRARLRWMRSRATEPTAPAGRDDRPTSGSI
jgi:hypothetical protein